MSVETFELDKKMLEYSISQLRNIPEYVKMCEAFSVGATTIQDAINYLSNMMDIDKSEGVWLDYLAWLVGTNRTSYDFSDYFCVNQADLNVEKLFYFDGISSTEQGNLDDIYLKKRIKSKIAYNTSKATRNENIKIIKGLVNADRVIIRDARTYNNFTMVGSPTVNSSGVASGFSNSKYLKSTVSIDCTKPFKVVFNENRGNATKFNGFGLGRASNVAYPLFFVQPTSTSYITLGLYINGTLKTKDYRFAHANYTDINYIVSWDKTQYVLEIINTLNNETILKETVINSMALARSNESVGYAIYGYNFNSGGSIQSSDLNYAQMQNDGKLVYVPYTSIPMLLDITLQGDNLFYPSVQSLRNTIESLLGNGVGVRNLTIL